MKLSIVIVNYNVKYFLAQALQSVEKACASISAEIFVVDNASTDNSVAMIKKKFPRVILLENKQNVGFAKANNQAISMSRGEYVLLLNPDTVVEEDTFVKSIHFMDRHKDVGALGVKMLDGTGCFLPESKRGLPLPWVAFCKVFGLSRLFPYSKRFGQYHLTYLDKNKNHQVDVLSGAYMFVRKRAIDEVGLLDETFFMYGEDIDWSYRFIKQGYKNYYLAETSIIHYKGESTKKGSLNYVKVFYEAMLIFSKKHFNRRQVKFFSLAIYFAIVVRALYALIFSFFRSVYHPLLDILVIYIGMGYMAHMWAIYVKASIAYYPSMFFYTVLPIYAWTWVGISYLLGVYDKPYRGIDIWRSVTIGTLCIGFVFAFLPNEYRFSRAIIVLGAFWSVLVMFLTRLLDNWIRYKRCSWNDRITKRIGLIGGIDEVRRARHILSQTSIRMKYIGMIFNQKYFHINEYKSEKILGGIDDTGDIVAHHKIDELIFCAKDVSWSTIIQIIGQIGSQIDYKIIPRDSDSIIGSHSKNTSGDLYAIDVSMQIAQPRNRRNKRLLDLIVSILVILISPILFFLNRQIKNVFLNAFDVFVGRKTWVGYSSYTGKLPRIRPSVFHIGMASGLDKKSQQVLSIDLLYAKEYSWTKDIQLIVRNLNRLGENRF